MWLWVWMCEELDLIWDLDVLLFCCFVVCLFCFSCLLAWGVAWAHDRSTNKDVLFVDNFVQKHQTCPRHGFDADRGLCSCYVLVFFSRSSPLSSLHQHLHQHLHPPPQTKRGWTLPRSMNTHTLKKRQDKKKKARKPPRSKGMHDPQESTSHCFHDEMLMLNGSCGLGGTKSFFLGKTSIGSVGSGSTWGGLYMASRIFTKDCRSERNRGERCMKETNKTKQNHMQPNKIKKTNKPTNEDPPYSYPTPNTHTRTHAHTTQKHTFFEPGVEPTTKMRLWRVSI